MAIDGARIGIVALVLSATGLTYIAQREGYVEKAYPDPVHGIKVPTIGFGTTQGVKMGDTMPPVRALVRLRADASEYELAIKRCLAVPMHQREFDAFVGLAYNAGAASVCFSNDRTGPSTIARRLQAGGRARSIQAGKPQRSAQRTEIVRRLREHGDREWLARARGLGHHG